MRQGRNAWIDRMVNPALLILGSHGARQGARQTHPQQPPESHGMCDHNLPLACLLVILWKRSAASGWNSPRSSLPPSPLLLLCDISVTKLHLSLCYLLAGKAPPTGTFRRTTVPLVVLRHFSNYYSNDSRLKRLSIGHCIILQCRTHAFAGGILQSCLSAKPVPAFVQSTLLCA